MLFLNMLRGMQRGDTLPRVLANTAIEGLILSGRIVDLGAGNPPPSYFQHVGLSDGASVVSIDNDVGRRPTIVADVEMGLPVQDCSADAVLCMNLLEHLWDFQSVITEAYRVLRHGGEFLGMTPFLYPLHPFPRRIFKDVFRYTDVALHKMLTIAGYRQITVHALGYGPASAALFMLEYPYVGVLRRIPLLRFLLYGLSMAFDRVVYFPLLRYRFGTRETGFVLMYVFRASKE